MFAQFKLYILGAAALAFIGLAGTVYIYKLKFEKAEIKQQVAEQQRDTMMEVNKQILAANIEDAKLREKIYSDLKGARDESEAFKQKIAEHDLNALATARPDTLTRLARAATERVLRDIEDAANGTTKEMPRTPVSGHSEAETSPANRGSD